MTTTAIGHIAAIQRYPATKKNPAALIIVIETANNATAWQLHASHPTYNTTIHLQPRDEVLITHNGTHHHPGDLTAINTDPIVIAHHRTHPNEPLNHIYYDPYTPPDQPA